MRATGINERSTIVSHPLFSRRGRGVELQDCEAEAAQRSEASWRDREVFGHVVRF
jgi:hypothetical protein